MFEGFYIEHKRILVKLESCALSCNVTYNERYIKDLFLSKGTETGHSNLIQNTWMWAYKKVLHHKSLSKQCQAISEQSIRSNFLYMS